ncbi:MAG: DNA-processing protein DprA, partial [Ignavibacteria bacterium]|nr:DNA-processing protein DprA [Ignavibacteria bacterium]
MNDLNELAYLKLLSSTENIGPQKILALKSHFKTFENIYASTLSDIIKVEGIHTSSAFNIVKNKINFESSKKILANEMDQLKRQGARLISYWDDEYPSILRNIYYPPVLLYLKGSAKLNQGSKIAIVGTRTPTHYGRIQAENFAAGLVENNLIIVSGLARGIDSAAHNSALK